MFERIKDPIRYESKGVVVLVQVERPSGIGDHSLHYIIGRHYITQVVIVGF